MIACVLSLLLYYVLVMFKNFIVVGPIIIIIVLVSVSFLVSKGTVSKGYLQCIIIWNHEVRVSKIIWIEAMFE